MGHNQENHHDGVIVVSIIKNTRGQWRWYSSFLNRYGMIRFE